MMVLLGPGLAEQIPGVAAWLVWFVRTGFPGEDWQLDRTMVAWLNELLGGVD
jgi:hypothetical protein